MFRGLFGFIMALALVRFALHGWVRSQITSPPLHFPYPGLSFVRAFPEPFMHLHIAALIFLSLCLALGIYTRLSALCFGLGFTYFELIDQTTYLNHYYLVSLLSFLLFLVPVGRADSIDGWLDPSHVVDRVPRFCLLALRTQVAVVYVFAGLAKLNADWLLDAQPMRIWLGAHNDLPLIGGWLSAPWIAYLASWAGALFDLTIIPLMLIRRTRAVAFVVALAFHSVTGLMFDIGVFPWLMTICLTLFFEPDWPRHVPFARLPRSPPRALCTSRALFVLLTLHCTLQVALPLVQHRYQDSAWSYRGFNFAWRVMAIEKPGDVVFRVEEPLTGRSTRVRAAAYVTPLQARTLVQDPELIASLARLIASEHARRGAHVAIYADAFASLNGRPAQRLLDPKANLNQPFREAWILPLR